MNRVKALFAIAIAGVVGFSDLEWTNNQPVFHVLSAPVEARVGRPVTPLSYAGVARRTTRRVAYRTTIRVNSIPASCVYGLYYGGNYYNCGGVYYEKDANVYIQVNFQ